MNRILILTATCIFVVVFERCDDSFNPSAPFQPRIIVYSILSNVSDTQYVRVYTSYNPPNNDPSQNQTETSVTDAQVSIAQEGGPLYTLRPLVVGRPDTSRYTSSIGAYYAYPFRPVRGKKYTLTVSSPQYGVATGTTTFPSVGYIIPIDVNIFTNPWNYRDGSWRVGVALAPEAKAFLTQCFVDYLSPQPTPGVFIAKRYQVAQAWVGKKTILGKPDYDKWVYPWPVRRTTSPSTGQRTDQIHYDESFFFQASAYINKLGFLYCFEEGWGIQFTGMTFYLIQFDEPLWNYYNIANSFRDRYTIRIDEPSYTNIKGGFGVFGSSSVDSTAWPIPSSIPPTDPLYCLSPGRK
jgi:hypothetical protein